MFTFERNNKKVKKLVRTAPEVLACLANALNMDIASRFLTFSDQLQPGQDLRPDWFVPIIQNNRFQFHQATKREKIDLGLFGVTSTRDIVAFDSARVLAVHFRGGEWGRSRCGSVVTLFYGGCSRYCIVKRFYRVMGRFFASVTWLSKPTYPYAHITFLVVRVRMISDVEQSRCPCVIPADRIEPCTVAVMPDDDGVHYMMLRDKGIDRPSK